MASKRRIALRIALHVGVFVVAVAVFLPLVFPWERAARYAEAALAGRLDMDVRIGSVSPSGLTGLEFRDVTLRSRRPDARGNLRSFRADRVVVRASLGTLLGGDADMEFRARMMGGTIEGEMSRAARGTRVRATLRGISPGEITTLQTMVGLPIRGRMRGMVDLLLRGNRFGEASGTIDLEARDVVVGDGTARLRLKLRPQSQLAELSEFLAREDQGVAMPPMNVGRFALQLRVHGGTARVVEMGATSEHIEIAGEGEIDLQDPVSTSQVGLYIRYRVSDEYQRLDSEVQSMFESMTQSPRYRRALRPDGFFGFRLQGDLRTRIRSIPSARGPSDPV